MYSPTGNAGNSEKRKKEIERGILLGGGGVKIYIEKTRPPRAGKIRTLLCKRISPKKKKEGSLTSIFSKRGGEEQQKESHLQMETDE